MMAGPIRNQIDRYKDSIGKALKEAQSADKRARY